MNYWDGHWETSLNWVIESYTYWLHFTTKFNIDISKDYARKDTTQLRIVLSADLRIQ